MNEYEKQANDFLEKVGATIEVKFVKHAKHFDDDKQARDIYEIKISKKTRSFTFMFGNSLNSSFEYIVAPHLVNKVWNEQMTGGKRGLSADEYKKLKKGNFNLSIRDIYPNPNFKVPTAYDVLTCLQKYDVGTLENFCSEFGYNEDSKKAEKTYNAVAEEFKNVCMLFSDSEIEELQEIQ